MKDKFKKILFKYFGFGLVSGMIISFIFTIGYFLLDFDIIVDFIYTFAFTNSLIIIVYNYIGTKEFKELYNGF